MLWHLGILMGIYLKCKFCEGSCGEKNYVVGSLGGDIIFQVDPVGVMGDITWFISGNHFATTERGKNIKIRDDRYNGKVYGMEDGSLLMKNLASKDLGTYVASTLKGTSGKEKLCALIYDLRVYGMLSDDAIKIEHEVLMNETCNVTFRCVVMGSDVTIMWENSDGNYINVTSNIIHVQNPDPDVIYTCTARNPMTNTSKSITPWEYCKKGRQQKSVDYTVLNMIRINLAGCLLIITALILGHHIKTEVVASSGDNG
ncbi:T-lymphocyte surface antigen Ly-9-like [Anomaloglossus baeobatrachus]|uniref:T-lymphocyte surface antigen Ly-9-like n=1 Tax=Anomaloglossus baeobatrachus TaxID=238106 RepID=UPI003F505495